MSLEEEVFDSLRARAGHGLRAWPRSGPWRADTLDEALLSEDEQGLSTMHGLGLFATRDGERAPSLCSGGQFDSLDDRVPVALADDLGVGRMVTWRNDIAAGFGKNARELIVRDRERRPAGALAALALVVARAAGALPHLEDT